jgi:hypothetical protein
MEFISMFFMHFFKVAEYFVEEGLPVLTAEQIPYIPEALVYNLIKIIEIYLSGFT